jgi:enterochelin esterase-like enzyme
MIIRKVSRRLIAAAVCSLMSAAFCQTPPPAQAGRGGQGAPPVRSPEVLPDGRVTFRLSAPKAAEVRLNGNWPNANDLAMTKDELGVWSVTAGPLKPELWTYRFTIDGVRSLDPRNVNIVRDGANYLNSFIIAGPGSADYQINDVPHGSLNVDWYPSPTLKLTRRLYVYTPAGYHTGTQRYPVLYLLHGGGGDEDAWTSMGRAPQIFDNLIAQGKAKPMLVVMTNGNANQTAAQSVVPPPPSGNLGLGGPGEPGGATVTMQFPESLVNDVIPYIEKTYRTIPDRQSRAVAGLSMGGAQSLYAGLIHLDKFAWIAGFSGGYPLWPGVRVLGNPAPGEPVRIGPGWNEHLNVETLNKMFAKVDAKANSRIRLMFLSVGLEDGLVASNREFGDWLKSKGIQYVNVETPGYGHVWPFWRITLIDLASRLFQPR